MARRPRNLGSFDDQIVHVLNRGNGRQDLFTKDADFAAFLALLEQARQRFPAVRVLAYCLMHNHWHLVLWPKRGAGRDLSRFMGWLCTTHVRRWRAHRDNVGHGHLYQGRFKSFVVQDDERHLLVALRYVEANPLRARMVKRAQDWPWSSLGCDASREIGLGIGSVRLTLCDWPIDRPDNWQAIVNELIPEQELARVRTSIRRDRPLGDERWTRRIVKRFGLEATLRDPWRPRKQPARSQAPLSSKRKTTKADADK